MKMEIILVLNKAKKVLQFYCYPEHLDSPPNYSTATTENRETLHSQQMMHLYS